MRPTDLSADGDAARPATASVSRRPPRCRVAVGAGGSLYREEMADLLLHRLRLVAPIALLPSLLFLVANLLSLDAATAKALTLVLAFQVVTVVVKIGLIVLLWTRSCLSLRALRAVELTLFGMMTAFFGWLQYIEFRGPHLYELGAPDKQMAVVRLAAVATSMRWFFLIVIYGVFIPNTWRRCALMVGGMALVAVTLTLEGLVTARHLCMDGSIALGYLAIALVTASAVAIFGSYRIHRLQEEALEAERLGQYRLQGKLGGGGMGVVYLAEHILLKRPAAVKLIRPEQAGDPTTLERFEREVRAMATLTHWNSVEVFDYGRADDGTFFYVMEYLPGLTLEQLVTREGALPPGRAVHLMRQVCRALREAHGIGLLHRDIKPSNVIVGPRGGEPDVAKLLDYGLVQSGGLEKASNRLTLQGTIVGSPPFMSPEQAAGKELTRHSDIYSVGAVLYYLLTGQPPFLRETTMLMLMAHAYDPVVPPGELRPGLPADLQAVVLRCLEKEPAKRYAEVAELEKALGGCACAADWTEEEAAAWWQRRRSTSDTGEASILAVPTTSIPAAEPSLPATRVSVPAEGTEG
jgi:serine/threonine-protein kinase